MDHLVDIQDLTKKYGSFRLSEVNLTLARGEILGLIGPNGSGKTTTLRIMMDMVRRDGGTVRIFGMDPQIHARDIKNRVGYVDEQPFFYSDRTVSWTGRFVSSLFRRWDTNEFERLLTEFGISRTKKIRELSKGMKVKFTLALALSHEPELLILDEPTAGLDPIVRREVLELLRTISRDRESAVIISSHITDDIARTADRIAFLVGGRIKLTMSKDDLMDRWKRVHFKEGSLPGNLWETLANRREHMFGNSGITGRFPEIKDSLSRGMEAGDIKIESVKLDDILISLVEGENSCGH